MKAIKVLYSKFTNGDRITFYDPVPDSLGLDDTLFLLRGEQRSEISKGSVPGKIKPVGKGKN